MNETAACDVLIAGSGAGGMATALSASHAGLDVLVVEKEPRFGGSTAFSAGVVWIPANAHARRAGLADTPEAALTYLASEVGNRLDRAKAEVFCRRAAEALDFFESKTHVRYALQPTWADYHPNRPGGVDGGRSLLPAPFDGRLLGEHFAALRPPLETMTILGGMMVARDDLPHLFNFTRSLKSLAYVAGLVARYAMDRLSHPRGTRIANGNALVARLARSLLDRNIPLWLSTPLDALTVKDGRVVGATVRRNGRAVEIVARRGVVLACGGFPSNAELRRRLYAHVGAGKFHLSLAPSASAGDGIRIAQKAGAAVDEDMQHPAAWTPISLVPKAGGGTAPFPHFVDRGKPGYIAVDRRGRRFVNESLSYHDFIPAMIEACKDDERIEAFLICDRAAIRRFGLGAVPPAPLPLKPHLASGYLFSGATIEDLAAKIGVDPAGLRQTVDGYNPGAREGKDTQFGKGGDAYQRFNGAAGHAPNPCVAPIETPPYYAVRLLCGDIGTFAGLKTDPSARVLDETGAPIPGLYAVGNDMASVMGGTYPGAGITIGPALAFGYLAGLALAERA